MIKSQFSGEKINSNSVGAFSLYQKSRFGERKGNKIQYSPVEALFLIREGKMQVFSKARELQEEDFLKKAKKLDRKIEVKLPVFTHMRKKGYVLKTALKFGAEFRVYKKGIKPGEDHALWLLNIVKESDNFSWYDFVAKNRVAHSARKKLLIAVVDSEEDVTFYEISWLRP